MTPLFAGWLAAALLGHAALWIAAVNRLHGYDVPKRPMRVLSLAMAGWTALAPVLTAIVLWQMMRGDADTPWLIAWKCLRPYVTACAAFGVVALPWRMAARLTSRPTKLLRSHAERVFDLRKQSRATVDVRAHGRWLAALPGNQTEQLAIATKELALPGLPPALDGFSIAHLSDLHFSGRVGHGFFDEVVRATAELDADMIAMTGDFVDGRDYIAWLPEIVGRLTARRGVYFILGNHDKDYAPEEVRMALTNCGFLDLGGRSIETLVCGQRIVLAGNEAPWFPPPSEASHDGAELRILLAHSPDQIAWARRHRFDLMLAGHVHGGQFAAPWIGPLLVPSRYGARYAAGVFDEPPTALHVTRGLSSEWPLRWNCRPELVKLVLRVRTDTR